MDRRTAYLRPRSAAGEARRRLRARMWPIVQTAVAAVAAWYLAVLALPSDQPVFAPIAAVIAVGATSGQRGRQAAELVGGVVLGIAVADLIVGVIGTGPLQVGVLVVLAMSAAVAVGGGELLVSEAAVSAILLASLEPVSGPGLSPDRFFEALVGGGVAFAVSSLFFPPDPVLHAGRALNAMFGELGGTLQAVARALAEADEAQALRALQAARQIDDRIDELERELSAGRETARLSPQRRHSLGELERYSRTLGQLDYAVRDTRVLARNVLRHVRGGAQARLELASAVDELADAVWALAAAYDDPRRANEVRRIAVAAASGVTELARGRADLGLAEIVVQIRSIAADLVRAADRLGAAPDPGAEPPTEELLATSS
jgi:uncharacterized membrane protein YgaE (UPF0421/DUF939 family)